jgi:hypothetical protein
LAPVVIVKNFFLRYSPAYFAEVRKKVFYNDTRGQCYKKIYGRNLRIFVIS